ncbi:FAD/NAD(P)-binding oxidoreductase family protein [Striga hermonthica]|uniref:FAD/NAD(P)-binding oxidoreductase family protein n=1 Tax=Striga hermonthica TaxID=68872 RepID=A0A9N7NJ69_STRHE|nr:FAD/NAD(P)-binding oxidoreductase family protein [Striga hermonthica]
MIVGGGPTVVELAAEIIVDFPDKKLTLKVEVILGQSVKLNSRAEGAYETSGGETIIADCHFLCTGNPLSSSWLKDTILKDSLDMHGRLMVDANLRVKGHTNIFVIGDITKLKQGYVAQAHASVTAKNLKLLMQGENKSKLSTYKPGPLLALVSLGRREGVARPTKTITAALIRALLQHNRKLQLSGETPHVVVITSSKGGKTTTTANIGHSLARLGFFVVAIDANVGLRNLNLLIGLENRIKYTVIEVLEKTNLDREDSGFSSSIPPISARPRDDGDKFAWPKIPNFCWKTQFLKFPQLSYCSL